MFAAGYVILGSFLRNFWRQQNCETLILDKLHGQNIA